MDCASLYWHQYAKAANAESSKHRNTGVRNVAKTMSVLLVEPASEQLDCMALFWRNYAKTTNAKCAQVIQQNARRQEAVSDSSLPVERELTCSEVFWLQWAKSCAAASAKNDQRQLRLEIASAQSNGAVVPPCLPSARDNLTCNELFWLQWAKEAYRSPTSIITPPNVSLEMPLEPLALTPALLKS
jgi:hypothetical protein